MELNDNHISLTSRQVIVELRQPLKLLRIEHFAYGRFYLNGSSIVLATCTEWFRDFLRKEIPRCVNVYSLPSAYYFWQNTFPVQSVVNARNNFGIDNAFNLHYQHEDHAEIFTFASKLNDSKAVGYFLSNIDLLEKFGNYFKEQAALLIKESLQQKIIIPEIMRGYEISETAKLDESDRNKFLRLIGEPGVINSLSDRKYQCLKHLSHGKTVKEIAAILQLKPKTVQGYIDDMKILLRCSRPQLIKMFWASQEPQI